MDTDTRSITASQQLLHAAQRIGTGNFSEGGVAKMQSYFVDKVRAAIAEGANLQAVDDTQKDAVEWLAWRERSTGAGVSAAKILIDAGYPILDTDALHSMEGKLFDRVCEHLARKERDGVLVRNASGGNLLHALAKYPSAMVEAIFPANSIMAHGKSHNPWAVGTDNHGRTPLHIAWTLENLTLQGDDLEMIWPATRTLETLGASLDACDHEGTTVLDLIGRAIQTQSLDNRVNTTDEDQRYIANTQGRLMDRTTPQVSTPGKIARL